MRIIFRLIVTTLMYPPHSPILDLRFDSTNLQCCDGRKHEHYQRDTRYLWVRVAVLRLFFFVSILCSLIRIV